MKVRFEIEYKTVMGENLVLVFPGKNIADKKYPMTWGEGGIWSVEIETSASSLKDYTYLVVRDGLIIRTEWKHHKRELASLPKNKRVVDNWIDCPIEACPFPRELQAEVFNKPGYRGAGVAIPVFSLRSKKGFGIGEFNDLRYVVDWAASVGMQIVQLLPVNDTTRCGAWEDSYPYSPISSFALHPLYIHLQDIGIKEDAEFITRQAELNSLSELDYPKVYQAKSAYIRKAFLQNGEKDLARPSFKKFVRENTYWLEEYSAFCAKRDNLEVDYYKWVQWQLEKQFAKLVDYGRSKGVYLKGDLPIGVSADSAEAFWHPELFNLDSSTGAPPDYFSVDGQNWGFPTYNWEEMSKDDYTWWKSRLRKMSRFFDAFRIDHIIGFFRIWEIPKEFKSGKMGHFNPALPYSPEEISSIGLPIKGLFHQDPRNPGMYQPLIFPDSANLPHWQQDRFGSLYNDFFYHRHEEFWRRNAERKLPELLGATGMLACGEDLGMVPNCVPGVMEKERILSLRMRGMEGDGPRKYLSVCATSSHDLDTLRMQCVNDPEPQEIEQYLREYLFSPSILAIFPMQDWLALDKDFRRKDRSEERINQPADPHHKWRFRLHFNLEELSSRTVLNEKIVSLIKQSNREPNSPGTAY